MLDNNKINLKATIYRLAHLCIADHDVDSSDEEFKDICQQAIMHYVRASMHNNFIDAGVQINVRSGDIIPNDKIPDYVNNGKATCVLAARQAYAFIMDGGKGFIEGEGRFANLCLVANALHRELCDGHNWFTNKVKDETTTTFKCTKVCGEDSKDFARYMTAYGHDLYHYMDHATIKRIARAMVGVDEVRITGNAFDKVFHADGPHVTIKDIMALPSSTSDRYPPNTIGASSIHLVIPIIINMIDNILYKAFIDIDDATPIKLYYNELSGYMKINGKTITRDLIVALRSIVGPYGALAIGFGSSHNDLDVSDKLSLIAFQKNYSGEVLLGEQVGKIVKAEKVKSDEQKKAMVLNCVILPSNKPWLNLRDD